MDDLKFFLGLKADLGTLPTTNPTFFYVTTDEGAIYLNTNKWVASNVSKAFVSAAVTTVSNQLIVTFTAQDGTTTVVPLLNGIDGDATNITIDNNGDITVDVVMSTDVTNGANILIQNSDGLYSTIKPTYSNGQLQLQYWDGTTWANVGSSVEIIKDSFLAGGTFAPNQASLDAWWAGKPWDDGVTVEPTITVPSIVLVMATKDGSETTYDTIIIPADDLFTPYTFTNTESIHFTTTPDTLSTIITADINLDTTQDKVVELDITDGLKANFNITDTQGNVTLTKETDGLKGVLKINPTNASLKTDADGVSVKISTTTGNILTTDTNGLFVPEVDSLDVDDTNSIDLTVTTGTLTADLKTKTDGSIEVTSTGAAIKLGTQPTETSGGVLLESTTSGLVAKMVWGKFPE